MEQNFGKDLFWSFLETAIKMERNLGGPFGLGGFIFPESQKYALYNPSLTPL